MLLAEFALYFGLIFAIIYVTASILTKFIHRVIVPLFKKEAKRYHSAILAKLIIEGNGAHGSNLEDTLLTQFIGRENQINYKSRLFQNPIAVDILQEELEKYFNVEILSSVCSMGNHSCQVLLRLIGKGGNSIYIGYASYLATFKDSARVRARLLDNQTTTLEDWQVKENKFLNANYMYILNGVNLADDNSDLLDLYDCINRATVEELPMPPSTVETTKVWRFTYSPQAGFSLMPTNQEITRYSNQIINLSYNDVDFTYQDVTKKITPVQQMNIGVAAIRAGQNIAIFGDMGTGKTTFARQMLSRLNNEPGFRIISISPSMVEQLQTPEAQGALIELLSQQVPIEQYDMATDEYITEYVQFTNVLMLDEAEQLVGSTITNAQAFLRVLLDGEDQQLLNTRMILIFNKPKTVLDPTIFRSGRIGIEYKFEALPMERAKMLAKELQASNLSRKFDSQRFHQFLTNVNASPASFITLADVTSCFLEAQYADEIMLILDGIPAPRVERKKPKVTTGSLGTFDFNDTQPKPSAPAPVAKVVQMEQPKAQPAVALELPKPSINNHKKRRRKKR